MPSVRPLVRWIKTIVQSLALIVVLVAGGLFFVLNQELTFSPSPQPYDLKLGSNLRSVARELTEAGVLREPWLFEVLGRVRGDAVHIKAGNYELTSPVTLPALLRKLTRGDATQFSIRFNEGWTLKQVRAALDTHEALSHETRGLSDAALARKLGLQDGAGEGWIFPETYYFSRSSSDLAVLFRAHQLMKKHLAAQWRMRSENLPLATPYEALILASIVEKETGKVADRAMVSSVFVNRLRQGMRLQTDPTVIYGMGDDYAGSLRRRHLQIDSPWNTYTRAGLPPTPIAMPGLASLQAAMNPASSNMLYFVARGDGSSHFSRTLDEHNAAVTKYIRSK